MVMPLIITYQVKRKSVMLPKSTNLIGGAGSVHMCSKHTSGWIGLTRSMKLSLPIMEKLLAALGVRR